MRTFSYTKTQYLIEELDKINFLRQELLLTPISLKDKSILRWTALLDKIYYSINLSGIQISQEEISRVLESHGQKFFTAKQKEIIAFKRGLQWITQEWIASTKPVIASSLTNLYRVAYNQSIPSQSEDLQTSLRYLQANPDHPIIQSALAQILILSNSFFEQKTVQMSFLASQLFLYKYGYELRRFLVLEEYYFQQKERYFGLVNQVARTTNATPWLEFVVEATTYQLNKLLRQIQRHEYETEETKNLMELNERQKQILTMLDQPQTRISNKMVQKAFKLSAITASRDLAKLTSLGFLFPIGKGRSTYYTKV